MFRVGVITVSDKGSKCEKVDISGPEIERDIYKIGTVEAYMLVPDEKSRIKEAIIRMTDELKLDLILTTGGIGLSNRDVTPESTMEVIEKNVPGIPEAIRYAGLKTNPEAMLNRAVAGIRGKSLIINLSGNPKGIKENLDTIIPILIHGLEILTGRTTECGM